MEIGQIRINLAQKSKSEYSFHILKKAALNVQRLPFLCSYYLNSIHSIHSIYGAFQSFQEMNRSRREMI